MKATKLTKLQLLLIAITFLLITTSVQAGERRWTGSGPHGGAVLRIVVDPLDPSTLFNANPNRGVFKSTNFGLSWKPSSAGLASRRILDLVVDPLSPESLYAATALGLAKSENGGRRWRTSSTGLPPGPVNVLAIDPLDPAVLYAGLSRQTGIYKTSDGGATWRAINSGIFLTRYGQGEVGPLAIDPVEPSTLYAQIAFDFYKTTDAGATWREIRINVEVDALVIDPSDPRRLYAASASRGVFTSVDRGETWTRAAPEQRDLITLAVDPSRVGAVYAGTTRGEILESLDGGVNWRIVERHGLRASPVFDLTFDVARPGRLYAGTTAGFFRSPDRGVHWREGVDGLAALPVSKVLVDPADSDVVYVGSRGGGAFKSTDRGGSWSLISTGLRSPFVEDLALVERQVAGGEPVTEVLALAGIFHFSGNGGDRWRQRVVRKDTVIPTKLLIDPRDPSVMYAGTARRGVHKSTNGGRHWVGVYASSFRSPSGFRDTNSMAIDEEGTIYVGFFRGILVSRDGGVIWNWSSRDIAGRRIVHLALDPADSRIQYVVVHHRGVYKTTDGGLTWRTTDDNLARQRVREVVVDPSSRDRLYAATWAGGVQISVDGGESWRPLNDGLPTRWVNTVTVDPNDPSRLYAGTDQGVFDFDLD